MKKTGKLLIGIVAGIILLVAVAFAVALSKPKPTYQAEDKPEGVAFNYLFALQQKDYARAYGYLSPSLKGYPNDAEKFAKDIRDNKWSFNGLDDSNTTLAVSSSTITGNVADVKIEETHFYEGDLFSNGQYTNYFHITLRRDASGNWKIEDSDSYWVYCWDDPKRYGCN